MKNGLLRPLLCLVALGWVGCTVGDETNEMCLYGCGPSAHRGDAAIREVAVFRH